ncbi:YisL family protein [Sutcliffiella rhizosphaerae]|uniref:UPF0344 protein BACCIP111883_04281 n=1 Tax=Sutcliffiella rhizosphaerae TaxID=2880967 RepID=A0ABN8AJY5_9BACI|nr:YisL family protein [Sutcliffiella rhizosphaerae]CAG9623468.1 hypothetical protein BACCIP111883_04281 [Sutcliffiella rhizosphaerae]
MTHAHISTWAIALILFVVVLILTKAGKAKGAKITSMVLRLFYILIVVTGLQLGWGWITNGQYVLKMVLGIVVIGLMEMIAVRTRKGKPTVVFWVLFIVALAYILHLGFSLPM